jgi:hypothetical protein
VESSNSRERTQRTQRNGIAAKRHKGRKKNLTADECGYAQTKRRKIRESVLKIYPRKSAVEFFSPFLRFLCLFAAIKDFVPTVG